MKTGDGCWDPDTQISLEGDVLECYNNCNSVSSISFVHRNILQLAKSSFIASPEALCIQETIKIQMDRLFFDIIAHFSSRS